MNAAASTLTTITGQCTSVRFRSEENGWTVMNLRTDKGSVCCVGTVLEASPEGMEYTITGSERTDPKFGKQFAIETATQLRPSTDIGLRKYLASGIAAGVGDAVARAVVDYLGAQRALAALDGGDLDALKAVPGIGEAKAQSLLEAWSAHEQHRELTVELMSRGLTAGLCVKIIKHFEGLGVDPLKGLEQNPYALTSIWGVGFTTADVVAQRFGIVLHDPRRLLAGAVYTLSQSASTQGHCYLPHSEMVTRMTKLCSVSETVVGAFLSGKPIVDDLGEDGDDDLL